MPPFNTIVLCKVNTPVLGIDSRIVLDLPSMKLGERLKLARKHAGISQEELGIRAGCGQAVVSKIERGDQEKTGYIAKLAKACGVNIEWLDEEIGEMIPSSPLIVNQDSPEYLVYKVMEQMDDKTKRQLLKIGNSLIEPENKSNGTK